MTHLRLNLEFAPGGGNATAGNRMLLTLGVLALALTLLALGRSLSDITRQSRELATLGVGRGSVAANTAQTQRHDPVELARAHFVRETSRSMNTPWADLLAAIEATPASVALLSVDPSANKRSVVLTAEAANATQMLQYLRTLQSDGRLEDVMLTSHKVQVQAVGTPLRFQVQARWGIAP